MVNTAYRLASNVVAHPSFGRWLTLALAFLAVVVPLAPIGGGGGV
jgi:hypothetical protein